jgi:hypothetical protein
MVRGEIGNRRRYAADVDDVGAGAGDPRRQRANEIGAGQATVATDDDGLLSLFAGFGAQRLADGGAVAVVSDLSTMPRMS